MRVESLGSLNPFFSFANNTLNIFVAWPKLVTTNIFDGGSPFFKNNKILLGSFPTVKSADKINFGYQTTEIRSMKRFMAEESHDSKKNLGVHTLNN